jgi:type VI secretion system protein ImpH
MNPVLDADSSLRARSFFELMRRVAVMAAAMPSRPSIERSRADGASGGARRRPYWLRLLQPARMDFAPTEVVALEFAERQFENDDPILRVAIRHFGLFAPYGPLPIHVTEQALHEQGAVFEQFFGHLTGELAWLDFKAWSHLHPVVGYDVKTHGNAFVQRLSLLANVNATPRPGTETGDRSDTGTEYHIRVCRTHFVGAYAGSRRPLHGLGAMLGKYFRAPVAVLPRTGGWQEVDKSRNQQYVVGRWPLGRRVFAPQSAMTILVGPIDAKEFPRFHRRQSMVRWMVGVAEDYAGGRINARLVVDVVTHPGMNGRVGAMRLGIDTWVSPVEQTVRLTIHEPYLRSATA